MYKKLLATIITFCLLGIISLFGCDNSSITEVSGEKENRSLIEWPMFHHDPQHTGHSTAKGNIAEPTLKWVFSTSGEIIASCAVGSTIGKGYEMQVVVGSKDGNVYVINSTGEQIWKKSLDAPIISSPLLADITSSSQGKEIIVASDAGTIYALSGRDGKIIWKFRTDAPIKSSPIAIDICGDGKKEIIISSEDGGVYVFDTSGNETWSISAGGPIESSPAAAYGRVYVGSDDHNIYCFDGHNGDKIWNYTTGGKITSSPSIAGGKVYVGSWDHKIYCLDAYTGNLSWSYTTGGIIHSSPAILGDKIYVGSYDRCLYCLDKRGVLMWKKVTNGPILSSPAIADIDSDGKDEVVVGSRDGYVYAFGAEDGELEWKYYLGPYAIDSSPAIADIDGNGTEILIGSYNGKIYAISGIPPILPPKTPERPEGSTLVRSGMGATYCTHTENETYYRKVKYIFDWGDGSRSETEPVNPSDGACISHSWSLSVGFHFLLMTPFYDTQKTFSIKCKAVAYDPDTGLDSDWSDSLNVTVYKPWSLKILPIYIYFIEEFIKESKYELKEGGGRLSGKD